MIKEFRVLVVYFIGLFLLNACSREDNGSDGYGTMNVVLSPNSETVDLGNASRSESDSVMVTRGDAKGNQDYVPNADDFNLNIYSGDVLVDYWEKFSDYDPSEPMAIGTYNVVAKYGDISKEGFFCPYYEGNSLVTIRHRENTDVSIECKLANVKVSVICSEALKKYFTTFTMEARSSLNNPITITTSEQNAFYLSPGTMVLTAEFEKQNGKKGSMEILRFNETAPQHHYIINVDVNNGEVGSAVLKVIYNTVESEEIKEIDLSDASLNIKEPVFTYEGIDNGGSLTLREGSQPSDLRVTLNARAGIKTCELSVNSPYLQSLGVPAIVDLASTEAEQVAAKQLLEEKGLRLIGLNENVEKLALIDFTPLVMNLICLDGAEETSSFTLRSTDIGGRVQEEEFSFSVKMLGNQFSFPTIDDAVMIGSTEAYVKINLLTSEGSLSGQVDVENVIFEYQDEAENWNAVETKWGGDDLNDPTLHFAYIKNLPAVHTKMSIRARYGSKISDVRELNYFIPDFQLTADDDDVWARKATAKITAASENELKAVLKFMEIQSDGQVVATMNENSATFELNDLLPDTTYPLTAICNGEKTVDYSLVTESALQLPNSDFEQWQSGPYDGQTINKGGSWAKRGAGFDWSGYTTYKTYETGILSVKEPIGWCTVNSKTMPLSPLDINFWYVVPSANQGSINSSNCIKLQNVGWDNLGVEISTKGSVGNFISKDDSYKNFPGFSVLNTPSTLKYSAGRLFLGSYSYEHSTGTEVYNEGYPFVSRPAKMTFQYKYTSKVDPSIDKGYVKVMLKSDEGIIFETYQELDNTTNVLTKTIEFNYPQNCKKATSICVMFCSSKVGSSLNQSTENSSISKYDIGVEEYKNQCCVTGSELYIDNIKLEY